MTMDNVFEWFSVAKHRKYLYRAANGLTAALVVYGLMSGEQAAVLLVAVNAVLGLADANAADVE